MPRPRAPAETATALVQEPPTTSNCTVAGDEVVRIWASNGSAANVGDYVWFED